MNFLAGGCCSNVLFQSDGGVDIGQSTGQTSLHQVLILVEVDVEVVEVGDFSTLGRTELIVGHVDKDSKKLLGLRLRIVGCTGATLKLFNSVNLADVQRLGQISLGIIDTTAIQIAGKKHNIQKVRSAEKVELTLALVLFASVQSGGDDSFGVDVILTEVGSGVGPLKFVLAASISTSVWMQYSSSSFQMERM